MVKLPVRLESIANMIPPVSTIADIGTDHGLLPVYLLQTGTTKKAIVSDVNPRPLEKARKTAQLHGMESAMDFRLGDGLQVLEPGEAKVIIIAGMGGLLINSFLYSCPQKARNADYLILQPMQAISEVREYLLANGYRVLEDQLVKEKNHFYHLIKVKQEELPATGIGTLEAMIGIQWKKQPPELLREYIVRLLDQMETKKDGLLKSNSLNQRALSRCEKQIKQLEEVIEWLQV